MSTIMTLEGPQLVGYGDSLYGDPLSDDLFKQPQLLGLGNPQLLGFGDSDMLSKIGYGMIGALGAMALVSFMKKRGIAPGVTKMLSGIHSGRRAKYSKGRKLRSWSYVAGARPRSRR